MAQNGTSARVPGTVGDSLLGRLGVAIVRHPWRAIGLWVVVILVCLYPVAHVSSVFSGTFSSPLPSTDESVVAQNAYTSEFPHAQGPASSEVVVLEGADILGPAGKNATLSITHSLLQDPKLKNVSSVESIYSAYSGYLAGQVSMGWSYLGPALSATPSLPESVNLTATEIWGPVAAYLVQWESIVANESAGTPESAADAPAYNATLSELAPGSIGAQVLTSFYEGNGTAGSGFNASISGGCLTTLTVSSCAEIALGSSLPQDLPHLFPVPSEALPAELVLEELDLGNWTSAAAQQVVGATVLGAEVGIAPGWILTIWQAFPSGTPPSEAAIATWVSGQVAADPIGRLPLPVPAALNQSFVDAAGTASLIVVAFNAPDTYDVNGSSVTFSDVSEIQTVVSNDLAASPDYRGITAYETGAAPLDSATNYLATSALGLLLVLTILVLLIIMLIYFRAPAAPALAFGMIGVALMAALAGIFLVGTFVISFNAEIESIVLVFLMSIGTDYSVFLLARYREELVKGTEPALAVETTVRWAGQSIATSGIAVMVVAAALTLSGISFLAELGAGLLLSVLFALLVNLTVLPSILALVGPRIFWPNSAQRFQRYAEQRRTNIETHRDPIARAGRIATRRPLAVILVVALLSAPVVAVALSVPVSYDVTDIGLPASNPAQVGFVHLSDDFGASYSSTSFALVTFSTPLLSGAGPDPSVIEEVAGLAQAMNATPGVAKVSTFVGPGATPLGAWLNFSELPAAEKADLNASLDQYLGTDGRTVLFNVETNASGYSAPAVSVLNGLRDRVASYEAAHPGATATYFGGAAPTTQDIESLVNQAEEEMLIGAAIGLFVIMLLILGSAFVPLLALGVIGLSILWSWAGTYFVVGILENEALIFLLPLILIILVLGLGMDYNVLLLTRVQEERMRGDRGVDAIKDAVTHAGGVITAAAMILGGAFLLLGFTSPLALLAAIGLGIGFAVLLQAFVVQLFLTPAVLTVGKDAIWKGWRRSK